MITRDGLKLKTTISYCPVANPCKTAEITAVSQRDLFSVPIFVIKGFHPLFLTDYVCLQNVSDFISTQVSVHSTALVKQIFILVWVKREHFLQRVDMRRAGTA